ncbi:hypothetical protein [Ponticoccus litoralis]|uniref:Transmembrane protein n=1 Tax=Ponticoccus litoralis TaxID=422297 RepID=A0AAW9SGC3_9RHOB
MKPSFLNDQGQSILKAALFAAVINGAINGVIQLFLLRAHTPLMLTVDGITNDAHTVFGTAVTLAAVLAMILTVVGHVTLKGPKRRFWPHGLLLTLWHGLLAFGAVVSAAVLWQRFAGSVEVSLLTASAMIGLIAALVAGVITYRTNMASRLQPVPAQ